MKGQGTAIALLSEQLDMRYLIESVKHYFPNADIYLKDVVNDTLPEDLDCIDIAICWQPPHGVLAQCRNIKLIQSIAAGIDHITADPNLPQKPLCRIIDSNMASGMAAYVCWAVTQHHRQIASILENSKQHEWIEPQVTPASQYTVGIAGLGMLGLHCAKALSAIGYQVKGWSRHDKDDLPPYIRHFTGKDNLASFLDGCNALVCLLPLTDETENFLSGKVFNLLEKNAHVINVGRGKHLVEEDLITALDAGQLGYATLDAFIQEPLPKEHPFWAHKKIQVTPHIATRTHMSVIAHQTFQNYELLCRAQKPETMVDVSLGY